MPTEQPAEKFDSTANQRIRNNVMRHEYRVLTDEEKKHMKWIKDCGLDFILYIDKQMGESRELSLAKTKMEEAVFWAVKHITGDR